MEIDRADHAIFSALQTAGRLSKVTLAAQVNLSEQACLQRVRRLEWSAP